MALKDLDLGSLESIVIVKPSSLGDVVHTLPLLALLRKHAPKAKIEWVVNTIWAPLLDGHPLLNGLIEFPRQNFRGAAGLLRMRSWLREQAERKPDLVIDVQGLLRSGLIARSLGAKNVVGYSDSREGARFFHGEVIDVSKKRTEHAVDRYLSFFAELEIDLPPRVDVQFPLPPGSAPECATSLPEDFLILHPFSRGQGKSLRKEQTMELATGVNQPVVIVGRVDWSPDELGGGDSVINLLNETTLSELIWLLQRAKFVVSVDSGPMHLAAAASSNLLSIHTWSDPLKVGPYRDEAWVWKAGEISQVRNFAPESLKESLNSEFPNSEIPKLVDFLKERMV